MRCPYCQGKKFREARPDFPYQLPCIDCNQTGEVCHLCDRPATGSDPCDCPRDDRGQKRSLSAEK